jgi:hypothetical protein
MQFVHQALTWGFLLALVPVLIHLINMMRHKRVQWAAMDFLLQSYKKHRRWVWLKQLLLLLARMAAIALLVAMLAQWVTQRQFLRMFGGAATHHYVLVDDSFSMSDRAGGASAFDLARQVVGTIARRAAESDVEQRLTVIRYSQAARAARDNGEGDAARNWRSPPISTPRWSTATSSSNSRKSTRRSKRPRSRSVHGPRWNWCANCSKAARATRRSSTWSRISASDNGPNRRN